jgi:hypothetical protein
MSLADFQRLVRSRGGRPSSITEDGEHWILDGGDAETRDAVRSVVIEELLRVRQQRWQEEISAWSGARDQTDVGGPPEDQDRYGFPPCRGHGSAICVNPAHVALLDHDDDEEDDEEVSPGA